jgi:hypothetical protein
MIHDEEKVLKQLKEKKFKQNNTLLNAQDFQFIKTK